MKAIIFYLLVISLSLVHNQTYGASCDSKNVALTIDESGGPAGDVTLAHHGVASCASLTPYEEDDDIDTTNNPPRMCCYAKVKYKIEGEKYTRKGCYDVEATENMNIDNEINVLENAFSSALTEYYAGQNVEIKDVEADIDCNSKFLKYSVLLILIALL